MHALHTFSHRNLKTFGIMLSVFCIAAVSCRGQVIAGVDVLTLISGASKDQNDRTTISSVVLDSANQRLICVFSTRESDLPTTQDAFQQQKNNPGELGVYVAVYDLQCRSLMYGSYLSGSGTDAHYSTCMDKSSTEMILTGVTHSPDFPVTANAMQPKLSGRQDLWYARFNMKTFEFSYITYLGGSNDEAHGYAMLASDGRLLIVGYSDSMNLPYDPHSFSHWPPDPNGNAAVFVLRNDTLQHVLHFGGRQDERFVGVHETDDSFVFLGDTWSRDIPVTDNAFQIAFGGVTDMFILRCDKEFRKVQYCSYLGGVSNDFIYSSRQLGNRIHIVGYTNAGRGFPLTRPVYGGDQNDCCQALYAIYDASTDEIPFSGLFGGKGGGTFSDIALVDEQKVILNMVTASDSIYGVVKAPPGDPSNAMELLIEFDLNQYQITHVHYPWNAYIGYSYMQFLPSSFGWYIYGAVGGQVPVQPEGLRTEFTGVQDAYIGRIFRNTNSTTLPETPVPRLLTITPYPNPAIGETTVVLFGPRGEYTLHLYDTAGRLRMERRIEHGGATATNLALPLSGLAPGRYHLVAVDAAGNTVASTGVVRW
jgi:hypothetical protein